MKTRVVNCKHDSYDVYIGRPSEWGNPFSIGKHGTRIEVIEQYREWLSGQWHLLDQLDKLQGKVLGCHCAPLACHGDILAALADERNKKGEEL